MTLPVKVPYETILVSNEVTLGLDAMLYISFVSHVHPLASILALYKLAVSQVQEFLTRVR